MIDKERYTRQIALEEVGVEGQELLARSSVLVVGVGGLGSPVASLLVSSGVGRVGIVDFDTVSLSNLPRQRLYTTKDIGKSKVACAAQRLRAMNPAVDIVEYNTTFDETSAEEIARGYDIIVDGCDNIPTRYIMDAISKRLSIPYIYGAIDGFVGQVSIFNYQRAAGYEELYPRACAPSNATPPAVMSTTPAIVGAFEANEALKIILGYGDNLAGKLLTFDSQHYELNIFDV